MTFGKNNYDAYANFILGRYARLTGMASSPALPVYLFVDPSTACNLRCPICTDDGNGVARKRPQALLAPRIYDSLLDEVGEKLFMISLYNWGEPLLNPHLTRFIRRAKEDDIYVDINTNLSLPLSDEDLEELLAAGPDSIMVSLDGFSQETYQTYRRGGNFDRTRDNITRLAALRDRLGLSTEIIWKFLVFSFNEHEVEEAGRFCAAKGITFSRKEAIIDVEKRPEWLPSYRRHEIGQKHGGWPFKRRSDPSLARAGMGETCIWHYSLAAVNSDGTLSPCCAVAEKLHDFGVIVPGKTGFGDIWNNRHFRAAREILAGRGERAMSLAAPLCLNCPYPFLKDFSGGLDTMIRREFAARFPSPDPLLAEAFRLFDNGAEFIAYVERNYERLSALPAAGRRKAPSPGTPPPAGVPAGSGVCAICGREVGFLLKKEGFSLRETFCPACGASRRSRDLAGVLLETCGAPPGSALAGNLDALTDLAIFEAQASGPLHEQLKGLPGYVCAEFLDGVAPGAMAKNGVRCEDLEALTFPDASFDLVITQDVLEHVADHGAAFREIARVLKQGGCHIFTVPLHEGRTTVTRARREVETVHLLPPVYHGDPLRSSGSLVYTDFGDDLPVLLAESGFAVELLPRGVFYAAEEIPRLDNACELSRLEELRRRGEHLKLFLYNSVVVRARRTGPVMQFERTCQMEHPGHHPDTTASSSPLNAMLDEVLEIVRHEPVSAAGLTKIGESCFRNDLATSAGGFFQAALERDPHCSDAMNNMGVLAFTAGDYRYAETLFINTLKDAPHSREARENLARLYNDVPHLAAESPKNTAHCPCCNGHFPTFIAGGPSLRPNACCPRCGSLERHRLLWLYLKERTHLFTEKLSVLHVAPEPFFQERFINLPNLDYVSADIASPLAMVRMDITDIQFPDNTFDVILCNHVLEHVPDDRLAMRELLRVLKPDGWAIMQVPIDLSREKTFEDPGITDPAERQRLFGQDDHVRWYGRDYPQRLKDAGFIVQVDDFSTNFDTEMTGRLGITRTESIFFCKAPDSRHKNRTTLEWPDPLNSVIIAVAEDYKTIPYIHPKDFIFDFLLSRMPDERSAVNQYFKRGDYSAAKLAKLINEIRGSSHSPVNLLDFASGYGSITRHYANHLPNHVAVTCCDIHDDALSFTQEQLGYRAIRSSVIPEQLNLDAQFEVIFALSFFSHMPEKTWARWLNVLLGGLATGGSLIFTTHGYSSLARAKYPLDKFTGFIYRKESEQKDLDVEDYGHTIVSPQFVSSCVPTGYHIISFREAEWEEHQDLYIIAKN